MAISPRALAVMALALLAPLLFLLPRGGSAEAIPTPVLASDNVELLTTLPGSAAISGEFSPSAPYFYTSGLDSITVFDISNPRQPVLKGKLPNLTFENESMTYGERRDAAGNVTTRFVLIGVDLYQAGVPTSIPPRGNVGGGEVVVVDVTDPASPKVRSRTPQGSPLMGSVTTSTHTVQCLTVQCDYAYTAGDSKKFSVIDLRDLDDPKQVATPTSAASGSGPISQTGSGHYWDVDDSGLAWHTGGGGTAVFDVTDPVHPVALNATNQQGIETPYNDFIHHNSMRPNARHFKPGAAPSLANGNVVLVTEEDYANDGDEVVCDRSGTFQTWELPDLDGEAYRGKNPTLASGKGDIKPLDIFQAPSDPEGGGGLSTPIGGFCSAHWFDYHQGGIVAQGWYQQGMRLIDVRDPKHIKQFGFFTAGATQVWDAYFVPARNADGSVKPNREKTNIVYTADLIRGLDVFEVKGLPAAVALDAPTVTTPDPLTPQQPAGSQAPAAAASVAAPVAAAPSGAATVAPKASCGAPTSGFAKASVLRRSGARLRGVAAPGKGCTLTSVGVAIGRKVTGGCRFLKADGSFGAVRSCLRTQYLPAKGLASWTLRTGTLPRGAYVVWSRATNSAGTVERKAKARNLLTRRVAR